MKKIRSIMILLCILLFALSAVGCYGSPYFRAAMLARNMVLFKGTVLEQATEGEAITEYTLQIDALFKGPYEEETITVKVPSGAEYLAGLLSEEGALDYLAESFQVYRLEEGKAYLFALLPFKGKTDDRLSGYYILFMDDFDEEYSYLIDENGEPTDPKEILKMITDALAELK